MTPLLIGLDLFDRNPASASDRCARLADAPQKLRIVLEAILEPIILRLETDEHARRLAVARDDNLLVLRQPEIAREIVLDLCERDLTARFRRTRGARLPLRALG